MILKYTICSSRLWVRSGVIPAGRGRSLREIVPLTVIRTTGNYFGNHWGDTSTEFDNREFYDDHTNIYSEPDIHLNELKGRQIAVCAEKAAVGQNLLSFLGYESTLVISSKCRLNSPDRDDEGNHVYQVVKRDENYIVFNPANPVIIRKNEGKIHTVLPAYYLINSKEYDNLMKGGQVSVAHHDAIWDGRATKYEKEATTRIYGGPHQATVI